MTDHPALTPDRVAVITGAASGIGLAAARRVAGLGLKTVLADLQGGTLARAAAEVAAHAKGGEADVRAVPTDVSRLADVERLRDAALELGHLALVMNNAAVDAGGGTFEHYDRWRRLLEVNLWGVINGVQAFAPALIQQGSPSVIVNTGSKQGITTPPGNAAYNVAKAGVKVVTEQLAHELRQIDGCRVTAHLLIPGFTYTGLTKAAAKPDAAWTAEQVADFLLEGLGRGDFYILCPDNAVTREMDNKRMQWAVGDIIEGRPALSRWHPDYEETFAGFMKG